MGGCFFVNTLLERMGFQVSCGICQPQRFSRRVFEYLFESFKCIKVKTLSFRLIFSELAKDQESWKQKGDLGCLALSATRLSTT